MAIRFLGLLAISLASAGICRAAEEPQVKAYACPASQVDAVANKLRAAYPGDSVRIFPDARTAQVLVQAPAKIQTRIEKQMGELTAKEPAAATNDVSRTVSLKHLTADQLESQLRGALGARLTASSAAPPGTSRYRIALAKGSSVELSIDRSSNLVAMQGESASLTSLARLIELIDNGGKSASGATEMIPFQTAKPQDMRKAVDAMRLNMSAGQSNPRMPMVMQILNDSTGTAAQQQDEEGAKQNLADSVTGKAGLVGSVQVEMLDGIDVIVVRGHRKDVDQISAIINQIEQLSAQTEPSIEICFLQNVNCEALTDVIRPLYEEIFLPRQGGVSMTPLVKPNAILFVGRKENVQTALDLVKKLDNPVSPDGEFRVFRLKHAPASTVQSTIADFYSSQTGLSLRVRLTYDSRTNSIVAQGGQRDLLEVNELIKRLDTTKSDSVNELRVFQLQHTLASDLSSIIETALGGQSSSGSGSAVSVGGTGGNAQQRSGTAGSSSSSSSGQRAAMLRFLTVDAKGKKYIESGLLNDVTVTADSRSNALVVSAPAESMELISALIRQLDNMPAVETQIKVFTIVNGDASTLLTMLQNLFGTTTTQAGGGYGGGGSNNQLPFMTSSSEGSGSLATLRFAVDARTNSIIASGSAGDLGIVEAILTRLDDSDVQHRKSVVYRLKNSYAADVAQALNSYLNSEQQIQQSNTTLYSAFEQMEREVVIVSEAVSNSLIISATPRFYGEIIDLVKKIDERPPMVVIQVLIAEVTLNNTDEFGVELGLQDGLLFDRSSASTSTGASTLSPGYLFNNQPLGNSANAANSRNVGGQGLSNFSLGRTDSDLGYGGFVFSASSESVSVLLRALSVCNRLEVLSRPQVTALDNQQAYVKVGQSIPLITGSTAGTNGQTNNFDWKDIGLILQVTPRVTPDNMVVMSIYAEKSAVSTTTTIPTTINASGQAVNTPAIDSTNANTVVSSMNGQTIVIGGMISKSKSEFHRKVPWFGDLPVLGRLFRYDGQTDKRSELLIIMTPHIIRNEEDAEKIKRVEAARMNWCLCDVIKINGDDDGLRKRTGEWSDSETQTVYPDRDPKGLPEPTVAPKPGDKAPAGTQQPLTPPEPDLSPSARNGGIIRPMTTEPIQNVSAASYQQNPVGKGGGNPQGMRQPYGQGQNVAQPAGYFQPNGSANAVAPASYPQTAAPNGQYAPQYPAPVGQNIPQNAPNGQIPAANPQNGLGPRYQQQSYQTPSPAQNNQYGTTNNYPANAPVYDASSQAVAPTGTYSR